MGELGAYYEIPGQSIGSQMVFASRFQVLRFISVLEFARLVAFI